MDESKKSQKPEEEIKKTVRPKAEKWFSYPDRQGNKFVGVQRVDDGEGNRKFSQSHVKDGKQIWNLEGVNRSDIPIYRYAEIQQAIADGKAIYLVEGEGKADQLWALGLPATCNLGGSGKFQDSDAQDLIKAKEIILCPDRDQVGLKHIHTVAAKIHALQPDLPLRRMNPYPEYNWGVLPQNKGVDVGDWIESGVTRFHIEAAIAPYIAEIPKEITPVDEFRDAIAKLKSIAEPFERALLQQEITAKYKIRGEKLEELLSEIVSKEPIKITSMAELFSDVYLEIQDKTEHPEKGIGITSGFPVIDSITGGWQNGDLIILAARPSMGKSTLALNLAVNSAKSGHSVAFVSLEMSEKQLMYKIIACESRINNNNLSRGDLKDDEWEPVIKAGLEIGKLPLKILDNGISTHSDICHKVKSLKQTGLNLLVIDYLQLLSSDSDNENVAIGRITRSLKLLAMELQIPIICLSQLSRAVEARQNKRPMLSDLRSSGSIEQDADLVVFMYRDEYYNPDTPDRGIAEVMFSKHRNGVTGTVKLLFEPKFSEFKSLLVN
jgi:replicative DNA helicase